MQRWASDKKPKTLDQKAWEIVEQMNDKDHEALDRFLGKICSTYELIQEDDARQKFSS